MAAGDFDDVKAEWIRLHDPVVDDVVQFFLHAPAIHIRRVADLLLKEGMELQYGMAGGYILNHELPEE